MVLQQQIGRFSTQASGGKKGRKRNLANSKLNNFIDGKLARIYKEIKTKKQFSYHFVWLFPEIFAVQK